MILHVADGCQKGIKSVLVYSGDTDVFISMLYHFRCSFSGIERLFIKLGAKKRTRKTDPIHSLVELLSEQLVVSLPAVHAITGYDTTSKVGSKTAVLKKPRPGSDKQVWSY